MMKLKKKLSIITLLLALTTTLLTPINAKAATIEQPLTTPESG